MHKHIGLVIVAIFVGVLLIVPGASDKLFAFVFIGAVPFTNYTLSVTAMLGIYAFLLFIALSAIALLARTAASPVKRDIKSRERARKKVLHNTAKLHPKQKTTKAKKHYLAATEKTA